MSTPEPTATNVDIVIDLLADLEVWTERVDNLLSTPGLANEALDAESLANVRLHIAMLVGVLDDALGGAANLLFDVKQPF